MAAGHTKIFLFNFSDRQLHGVYLATSNGQENMSLSAWQTVAPKPLLLRDEHAEGGVDKEELLDEAEFSSVSPFPAPCSFTILEEFSAVPEAEF